MLPRCAGATTRLIGAVLAIAKCSALLFCDNDCLKPGSFCVADDATAFSVCRRGIRLGYWRCSSGFKWSVERNACTWPWRVKVDECQCPGQMSPQVSGVQSAIDSNPSIASTAATPTSVTDYSTAEEDEYYDDETGWQPEPPVTVMSTDRPPWDAVTPSSRHNLQRQPTFSNSYSGGDTYRGSPVSSSSVSSVQVPLGGDRRLSEGPASGAANVTVLHWKALMILLLQALSLRF